MTSMVDKELQVRAQEPLLDTLYASHLAACRRHAAPDHGVLLPIVCCLNRSSLLQVPSLQAALDWHANILIILHMSAARSAQPRTIAGTLRIKMGAPRTWGVPLLTPLPGAASCWGTAWTSAASLTDACQLAPASPAASGAPSASSWVSAMAFSDSYWYRWLQHQSGQDRLHISKIELKLCTGASIACRLERTFR